MLQGGRARGSISKDRSPSSERQSSQRTEVEDTHVHRAPTRNPRRSAQCGPQAAGPRCVHDGIPLRSDREMPAVGGLGLLLVDSLTDEWGVRPGSTSVWFRFAPAA